MVLARTRKMVYMVQVIWLSFTEAVTIYSMNNDEYND
jgi:hypothetical protein